MLVKLTYFKLAYIYRTYLRNKNFYIFKKKMVLKCSQLLLTYVASPVIAFTLGALIENYC